jgi:hypothetical protein
MGKITTNLKSINGIPTVLEGNLLDVMMPGAHHISFALFQKGFPILIGFSFGEIASVLVKRKYKEIRGETVLKVKAYDKGHRGFGQNSKFAII